MHGSKTNGTVQRQRATQDGSSLAVSDTNEDRRIGHAHAFTALAPLRFNIVAGAPQARRISN